MVRVQADQMDGDESQGRADGQPDGQADSRAGGQPPAWRAVAGRSPEALKPYHMSILYIINLILLQAKLYPNWEFPTGFKPGGQTTTTTTAAATTTTTTTTIHT